jgi:hypothetical protein
MLTTHWRISFQVKVGWFLAGVLDSVSFFVCVYNLKLHLFQNKTVHVGFFLFEVRGHERAVKGILTERDGPED